MRTTKPYLHQAGTVFREGPRRLSAGFLDRTPTDICLDLTLVDERTVDEWE
jgi:hypothetical protein